MPDPNPLRTIRRTVLYTLTEQDAHAINHRVAANETQVHVSNKVQAGDVYPLIINLVPGSDPTLGLDGQILLNDNNSFRVTSLFPGAGEGKYQWLTRS